MFAPRIPKPATRAPRPAAPIRRKPVGSPRSAALSQTLGVHPRSRAPLTNAPPPGAKTPEAPARAAQPPQPSTVRVASAEQRTGPINAPATTWNIPFDRAPLAAPGERIIFNALFTDPNPADHRLEYTTTGGHFTSATGPTSRTIAGLASANVDFFVPTPWTGAPAVQVVLIVRKISDNSVAQTETWDFGLKTRYPTTMTQQEGTGERVMPAAYSYDIGPAVAGATAPYYQHQTILERFGNQTLSNIVPADIDEPYRTAQGLNTAAAVSALFLPAGSGENGTFTVNANDRIFDQHDGFSDVSNLVSHLVAPKEIHCALPQAYEAQPGTVLRSYVVTRIRKTDGTWRVKKG